jgi:excisionase family DNA binding protein
MDLQTRIRAERSASLVVPPLTLEAPMPEPSPWLTIDQAAERLQVSVRTVERMVQRGVLPEYRHERTRRYRLEDVDAALTAGTD